MPDPHTQTMQCMEVWGGNQPADSGVIMPGLDAWVYSRPHGDATGGGDVHYVSSCATGRITRLLVADVSGHGAAVSETAGKLRSLMRRYVNYIDQTRFVRALNDEFIALAQEQRFATAVAATFFGPTHSLALCNAGHPPPLFYEARTGTWQVLEQARSPSSGDPSNMPLGILDMTQYEQFALRLREGDMVLCYTDALIEAKDKKGEWLGTPGLLEIVRGIDVSEPGEFIKRLLAAIAAIRPGNLEDDDVTALLFRHNGLVPRISFFKKAMAPLRVLAAAFGSLRPGAGPAPWPEMSLANLAGAKAKPVSGKVGK
ncbi:MAG TPA: PP2C family protein-serine/threonine phosphatase [Phycisphaerae bacterium]|nr:PP2C family protein-serine/threonine phosphatase [Phycisphaerae bacterium]